MKKINSIGWFELSVNDIERAKDFYNKLFGWEYKLMQGSDSYWTIYTGENSIGGGFNLKTTSEDNGNALILYVEVENINNTLKTAVNSGGSIIKEKTLITENSGYYGLLKDADGNMIGLWTKG